MTRKNFCLYPFAAFSIDNPGHLRICCNNNAWSRNTLNNTLGNDTFNLKKDYNNPLHMELREYIIKDERHPSCTKCWEVEDEGASSYRQWFNESFNLTEQDEQYWIDKCLKDGTINDVEFLYLDISFGTKCNLKCVMCNEFNSTLMAKEKYDNKEIPLAYFNKVMKYDWSNDGNKFEKIYEHIDRVTRIHIVGGEPLLIEHQDFLQKFIDLGLAKNIVLSYNSNLTTLPRKILDCWKEFKKVYLCVSVDAYKELNEFIRFPMSWKKLENNLKEVDSIAKEYGNISIQIHATVSLVNCLDMVPFLNWAKQITTELTSIEKYPMFNYVFKPEWFDPVHLPQSLKDQALDNIEKWEAENVDYFEPSKQWTERMYMLKSYYTKIVKTPGNPKLYQKGLDKIAYFERIRGTKYPGNLLDNPEV